MADKIKFSLQERILFQMVSVLGAALIRLLGKTWRITFIGQEKVERIWRQNRRVCYAFWHGRLLVLTYTHRKQKIHVLVSQHRDGEFIARIINKLGYVAIRGSSTRGGARGVLELVKASPRFDLAITPDGPKGPPYKIQPGSAFLASRAGVPMIPVANSAHAAWYLKSWDRFMIPKPFTRVLVLFGEPIWVRSDCSETELQEAGQKLEKSLVTVSEEADRYFSKN